VIRTLKAVFPWVTAATAVSLAAWALITGTRVRAHGGGKRGRFLTDDEFRELVRAIAKGVVEGTAEPGGTTGGGSRKAGMRAALAAAA
jgi:hypothetical protein